MNQEPPGALDEWKRHWLLALWCAAVSKAFSASRGLALGIASSIIGLMLGFAPWFAGKVFDVTGSYQLVLTLGIPFTLAAGALLIGLGAYPEFEGNKEPISTIPAR